MVASKQDELVIDQEQSFLIAQKQVNMAYKHILNHLNLDRPLRISTSSENTTLLLAINRLRRTSNNYIFLRSDE